MSGKLLLSLAAACMLLFALTASFAADIGPKLQKRYQGIQDFQAEFIQELTNAASGEVEIRRGRVKFRKPDLLRLDTKEPEQEMLLLDGEYVWQYFIQDQVAYKYSLQDRLESETLLQLLAGDIDLQEKFYLQSQEQEQGLLKIVLEPRDPEPNLVQATLWLDLEQDFVHKLLLQDFFGNTNQIELTEIELNAGLSRDIFCFSPPQDVLVQDNTN